MSQRRGIIIGIAIGFAAGCAAGIAFGGYRGFRMGTSFIMNEALAKDAREVEARIATLGDLRAGEPARAVERLEAGLSDLLIIFDPSEPYAGLTVQTTTALRKAIGAARKYRSAYPRPSGDAREKMVDSLFARDLYK